MSRLRPADAAVEFESSEFDGDYTASTCVNHALGHILAVVEAEVEAQQVARAATERAVDRALEAVLCTLDTLFVTREDEVAVCSSSLIAGSWEPEAEPIPCALDTWLRAAIPESAVPSPSHQVTEYLRTASGRLAGGGLSRSGTGTLRAGATPPPQDRASGRLSSTRSSPSPLARKVAAKDQAAAEDRLREELEIRRAQLAITAAMDAKDEEAKALLTGLGRKLKGKDWCYDHKGRIVPLADVNTKDSSRLHTGATFRLDPPKKGSRERANQHQPVPTAAPAKGTPEASHPAQGSNPDRKLYNDFRQAPSRSQPSAMESMNLHPGVTLAQGAQIKPGPSRPHVPGAGMTRDEFGQYQQHQQQQLLQEQQRAAVQGGGSAAQQPGLTFPPIRASTAGKSQEQHSTSSLYASQGRQGGEGGALPRLPSLPGSGGAGVGASSSRGGEGVNPPAAHLQGEGGSARHSHDTSAFGDLFAIPDSTPHEAYATPRQRTPPQQKPPMPDANYFLVGGPDWGKSSGGERATSGTPLQASRPSKKLVARYEVGRTQRMPRDRAPQATISTPLSPMRLAAHQPQPQPLFAA